MPSKLDKIRLPKGKDRRVKLTDDQRAEIRSLYASGTMSYNKIADQFSVSKRLVMFVVNPEKYQKAREQFKDRRVDGRYYDTEKNTLAKADHRKWKKKVFTE